MRCNCQTWMDVYFGCYCGTNCAYWNASEHFLRVSTLWTVAATGGPWTDISVICSRWTWMDFPVQRLLFIVMNWKSVFVRCSRQHEDVFTLVNEVCFWCALNCKVWRGLYHGVIGLLELLNNLIRGLAYDLRIHFLYIFFCTLNC